MTHRLDLTQGNILPQLLRLAGPILAGMMMYTLYILTDLWFVGRLGPEAVAALAISSNVFFIHLGLAFILGTGAMALIARETGRGDINRAANIFGHSLILCLAAGIVAAGIGYAVAGPYVRFFGGTGKTLEWGVEYFRIHSLSIIPMLLLHVFGACYRGLGDTRTSMRIMFQGVVLNIILDPILIFGAAGLPAMGVKGAAVASLVSQAYGVMVYAYLVMIKKQHLDLSGNFRADVGIVRQSLSIGLPSGLSYFLFAANIFINYRYVGPFGTEALAALGVGFRLLQSMYLPSVAISEAMAAMAGQNYGAGRRDRVMATFWSGFRISALFMAAGMAGAWLFPMFLIGLFSKDPGVMGYGALYLKIITLSNLAVAVCMTVTAMFQGLGRTYPTLVCALADNLLFALLVFTLPQVFGWGITAVWWLKLAATLTEALSLSVWLYLLLQRIKI